MDFYKSYNSLSIIILYLNNKYHISFIFNRKSYKTNLIFIIISLITVVFSGFFSLFWNLGTSYFPERAVNVIYFFFIIHWMFLITNISACYDIIKFLSRKKIFAFLILTFVLLYFSGNFRMIYPDILKGTALKYKRIMQDRHQQLLNCNSDTCFLIGMDKYPSSVINIDIKDDPDFFMNKHLERYYKIKVIVLIKGKWNKDV